MSLTTLPAIETVAPTSILISEVPDLGNKNSSATGAVNIQAAAEVDLSSLKRNLLHIIETNIINSVEIDDDTKNKLSSLKVAAIKSTQKTLKKLDKQGKKSLRLFKTASEPDIIHSDANITRHSDINFDDFDELDAAESLVSSDFVHAVSSEFDKIKYPTFLFSLGAGSFFESINQGVTVADCLATFVSALTTFSLGTWTVPAFIACLGGNVLNGLMMFFSIFVVVALLGNIALDYGLDPSLIGLSGDNTAIIKRKYGNYEFGEDDFEEVLANIDQIIAKLPLSSFSLKKTPFVLSANVSSEQASTTTKHIFQLKLGSVMNCLTSLNNIQVGIRRRSYGNLEFRVLVLPKKSKTIYTKLFTRDGEIENFMIVVNISFAKLIANSRNFMFDRTIKYAVKETMKLVTAASKDAFYDVVHFRFMKRFQPLKYLADIGTILTDFDESITAHTESAVGLVLYQN